MARRGAATHPKIIRLSKALGMPTWAALGLMENIWHWAMAHAQDGVVERDRWQELSFVIRYDEENLRELLIAAGLVDELDRKRDYIHDWHIHCDSAVRSSLLRRGITRFHNGAVVRQKKDADDGATTLSSHEHASGTTLSVSQHDSIVTMAEPGDDSIMTATTQDHGGDMAVSLHGHDAVITTSPLLSSPSPSHTLPKEPPNPLSGGSGVPPPKNHKRDRSRANLGIMAVFDQLPEVLKTESLRIACQGWEEHARARRKGGRWTDKGVAMKVLQWSKFSAEELVRAVEESILQSWTGIFPQPSRQPPATDRFPTKNEQKRSELAKRLSAAAEFDSQQQARANAQDSIVSDHRKPSALPEPPKGVLNGDPIQAQVIDVVDYFNAECGESVSHTGAESRTVYARLKGGDMSIEDMKLVIDHKSARWLRDPEVRRYLKLTEMFSAAKYARALAEARSWHSQGRRPLHKKAGSKT